jgi:hypothetical protein
MRGGRHTQVGLYGPVEVVGDDSKEGGKFDPSTQPLRSPSFPPPLAWIRSFRALNLPPCLYAEI